MLDPVSLFLSFLFPFAPRKENGDPLFSAMLFLFVFQVLWSLRDISGDRVPAGVNQWQKHYWELSLRCFIVGCSPLIWVKVTTKYGCKNTFTLSTHYLLWQCGALGQQWQSGSDVLFSHQCTAMNVFYLFLPSLCFWHLTVLWQQQNRIPIGPLEFRIYGNR